MKTSLLIVAASLISSIHCMAQNKTLGVGTASPNPNAALHVESPASNQGFILPRLTSAQRTAMASLPLTSADDGLLVYDKDVKKIYVWNGSSWQLTASALSLPFSASDTSANSFTVNNTGSGNAAQFIGSGTGTAGQFSINNAGSSAPTINITHAGTGRAILANAPIQATQFIGDGSLLTNVPGAGLILPFRDSVSTSSNAFDVTNIGVGGAGSFNNMNSSSGFAALSVTTIGVSNAAAIMVSNPSSTAGALFINHSGLGPAIMANKVLDVTVTTDGPAGNFKIDNAGNSAPAVEAVTNGSGVAMVATTTGGSHAGLFQVNNSANTSNVIHATTDGLGSTGYFSNTNSGNTLATVGVDTNGSGFAVGAFTSGTGSAGHFQNNNPANTQPALIANSNGAAPALAVDQTNNGVALQINNGTVVHSVFNVPTGGGIITERAGIYVLSDNLSYTFGFGVEGETVKVMTASGDNFVEGVQIFGTGTIEEFVYIGGSWKMIGYCYTC